MQKESWGYSQSVETCQKYSIDRYLLLAGGETELRCDSRLLTIQVVNGNCGLYSDGIAKNWSEAADVIVGDDEQPIFLAKTELKLGDVVQVTPKTNYKLVGHTFNDSTLLLIKQRLPIVIDDEYED